MAFEEKYRLGFEFDENSVAAAAKEVERLEGVLDDATTSAEDLTSATEQLEQAQLNLQSSLKGNATGLDGLREKQKSLTTVQDKLNANGKAFSAVQNETRNNTKALAVETGKATQRQKSFGKQLVSGVRRFRLFTGAARVLGGVLGGFLGVNFFSLIFEGLKTATTAIQNFIKSLFGANDATVDLTKSGENIAATYAKNTSELNNLFGALNDATDGSKEQSAIISELIEKYPELNEQSGLDLKIQEDRAKAYRLVALRIAESAIASEKARIQQEAIGKILDLEVKRVLALDEANKFANKTTERTSSVLGTLGFVLENVFTGEVVDQSKKFNKGVVQGTKDIAEEQANLIKQLDAITKLAPELAKRLSGILDPGTLTGNANDDGSGAFKNANKAIPPLENSLKGLENKLSDLKKQLVERIDIIDPQLLVATVAKIKEQEKRIEEARDIIARIQGDDRAAENIAKLKIGLIEDEFVRRIRELESRARADIAKLVGTEEEIAEQTILINEKLSRDLNAIYDKREEDRVASLEETAAKIEEIENDLRSKRLKGEETDIALIVSNESRKLAIRLQGLEQRRNAEISEALTAEISAEERRARVEAIEKRFDAERIEAERETQRKIIEARIASTEATIAILENAGESTLAQKQLIEELRLELIELNKVDATIDIKVDEQSVDSSKKKIGEIISELVPLVQNVSDEVFNLINTLTAATISEIERNLENSRSFLDQIRANSENFNARQLELEKERLEKLEAERAKAARKEAIIAQTQAAFNAILAVSRAAAEGGIAAPFTIASTLIALIAGFASAKSAAGNAFFHGEEYVDRGGSFPWGIDTVPARLTRGERVITASKNRDFWPTLTAVHNDSIPSDVLNKFTQAYRSGGIDGALAAFGNQRPTLSPVVSLSSALGENAVVFNSGTDLSSVVKAVKGLGNKIENLPGKMPSTIVKGDFGGAIRVYEKRIKNKQKRKNRAK